MTRSKRNFYKVVEELELVDLPMLNGSFSWTYGREDQVFTLINRFLVSKSWLETFKASRVVKLARLTSDHFPITLEIGSFRWGPMPFRFENMWLDHLNFLATFEG